MLKVILTIMTFLFLGAAYDASAGGYSQASRKAMSRAVSLHQRPSPVRRTSEAINRPSVDPTATGHPAKAISEPVVARTPEGHWPSPLAMKPLPVKYAGKGSIGAVVASAGMVPLSAKALVPFGR